MTVTVTVERNCQSVRDRHCCQLCFAPHPPRPRIRQTMSLEYGGGHSRLELLSFFSGCAQRAAFAMLLFLPLLLMAYRSFSASPSAPSLGTTAQALTSTDHATHSRSSSQHSWLRRFPAAGRSSQLTAQIRRNGAFLAPPLDTTPPARRLDHHCGDWQPESCEELHRNTPSAIGHDRALLLPGFTVGAGLLWPLPHGSSTTTTAPGDSRAENPGRDSTGGTTTASRRSLLRPVSTERLHRPADKVRKHRKSHAKRSDNVQPGKSLEEGDRQGSKSRRHSPAACTYARDL